MKTIIRVFFTFVILSAGVFIGLISGCYLSISGTTVTGEKITTTLTGTPKSTPAPSGQSPAVSQSPAPSVSPGSSPVNIADIKTSIVTYYYISNVGTGEFLAYDPEVVSNPGNQYAIYAQPWSPGASNTEAWSLISPYQTAVNCFAIDSATIWYNGPYQGHGGNLTEPLGTEAAGDAIFWYRQENGTAYDWIFNLVPGTEFTYYITCQQDSNNLDISSNTYTAITSISTDKTVTPGQIIESLPSSDSLTQQWVIYPAMTYN